MFPLPASPRPATKKTESAMKENTSPICVYPCPSVVKIARCSGFQGPFRTLFHRRGPLRLVSDPKTASRQGRQGREEAFDGSHAAWRPLRSLREKLSEKMPVFRPGIAIFHRNLSRRRRERLFGPFFAGAARCGSFPIRKPSLAKDAKDAKKLSRNLTPLGALCDLCERMSWKTARTCHAEGVNLSRLWRERRFEGILASGSVVGRPF